MNEVCPKECIKKSKARLERDKASMFKRWEGGGELEKEGDRISERQQKDEES